MAKVNTQDDRTHRVNTERRPYGGSAWPVELIPYLEKEGVTLEEAIEILGTKKGDGKVFWNGERFMHSYTYHVKNTYTSGEHVPVKTTESAILSEIIEALQTAETKKLDRRISWREKAKDRMADLALASSPFWLIAAFVGVIALFAKYGGTNSEYLHKTPESYLSRRWAAADEMKEKTSEHFWKTYKATPPELVSMASAETGIDEAIFRAMIAYGKSDESKHLRDKGYLGLIPVEPVAAGVLSNILENDDYASLLAFAEVYKRIKQVVCDDETALGVYLTSEKDVTSAKAKAWHATFVLNQMDERLKQSEADFRHSARNAELRKCVIDGVVPGEELFEPIVVDGEVDELYGSEEALRGLYERVKEEYAYRPELTLSIYNKIKLRVQMAGLNPGKEPFTPRDKFEKECVWFANLPDYASGTIARIVRDVEW